MHGVLKAAACVFGDIPPTSAMTLSSPRRDRTLRDIVTSARTEHDMSRTSSAQVTVAMCKALSLGLLYSQGFHLGSNARQRSTSQRTPGMTSASRKLPCCTPECAGRKCPAIVCGAVQLLFLQLFGD